MGQYSKVISETISRLSYGFEDQRDLVYSETGMLFYTPPVDDTESEDDLRKFQLYPFREEQLLSMENEELAMPQVSLHIVILMDAFFAAVDDLLQTPFLKKKGSSVGFDSAILGQCFILQRQVSGLLPNTKKVCDGLC